MSGIPVKSAAELVYIEAEYIKSLQRQIYFLELEINYLQEKAMKATGMHPVMMLEAENMLDKLRTMQSELDRMNLEMKRHDTNKQAYVSEKERTEELLALEKESHQKEKTLLTEELVTIKKEIDRLTREQTNKNDQIQEVKSELDRSALKLNNADMKINSLKMQIDQTTDQISIAQTALEEKKAQLLTTEAQLQETEDKCVFNAFTVSDKVHEELRDEICALHQKVKEIELETERNRLIRDKTLEDIEKIVLENYDLNQQLTEVKTSLGKEKELQGSASQYYLQCMTEVAAMKEKLAENDILRSQLEKQQETSRQYLDQLTNENTASEENRKQITTLKIYLSGLERKLKQADSDHVQLRNEKLLLVDYVSELHNKIEDKDREIMSLMASFKDMETELRSVDLLKSEEVKQNSQNLVQFSNLADSMKSLAHSMKTQTSNGAKFPGQISSL